MLFRHKRFDADFNEEIQSHIALETDRLISQGMSSDAARAEAIRRFGNVMAVKERFYETHRILCLDHIRQDLRYALRSFRRNVGFTVVAVLTLALGIGANSAIFSVINAVLLKPLPYKDPDQLVRVVENVPAAESRSGRASRNSGMSPEDASELRMRAGSLSHVVLYSVSSTSLTGREETLTVQVGQVSPSTFQMLGVQPLLGRVFDEAEEKAGIRSVVILSYAAWAKYFAMDRNILNQTLTLDAQGYSVIGVMPEAFEFPNPQTEFWRPFVLTAAEPGEVRIFGAMARLKDGVSLETASAEVGAIVRQIRGLPPDELGSISGLARIEVIRGKDEQVGPLRPALIVLVVAVGFVLLIACTNVANLLLARTVIRRREIAIRASLGAGRWQLIRQVLTESVLLAAMGGVLGVSLAFGGVEFLMAYWPGNIAVQRNLPRLEHVSIDVSVLTFTLAVSILTGLLFGLIPALRISRIDHMDVIKESTVASASGARLFQRNRTRNTLVVAEITMTMVLLVSAGLLIHSFLKLSSVNSGFDPKNVLTFQVALAAGPGGSADRQTFNEDLIARLQSLPGVQAAGYSISLPLEVGLLRLMIQIPGISEKEMFATRLRTLAMSKDYLRAVGVRLVEGRFFTETDGRGNPPAMLINRAMARRFFAGENPIGKSVISVGNINWEIVGIVDDVRQRGLDAEPEPQFFVTFRDMLPRVGPMFDQLPTRAYFAVRTDRDPRPVVSSIRGILRQVDSRAAMDNVTTLEEVVSNSIAGPRFYAVLLGVFATVAVALALIGIYGIVAYSVTQRTREVGIRIALGASRNEIFMLILRQGMVLAVTGVLLGLSGAIAVTRYLSTLLFGLTPLDPLTFISASAAFLLVAILASYFPAHRATRVNPVVALRYDN